MTTVTLELPEQIVRAVEQRAQSRGMTLSQQVTELLEAATKPSDDSCRSKAIRRMNELFDQVRDFKVEARIPREELYERGNLH